MARLPIPRAKALSKAMGGPDLEQFVRGLSRDPAVEGAYASTHTPGDIAVRYSTARDPTLVPKVPESITKVKGMFTGGEASQVLDNELKKKMRIRILQSLMTGGGGGLAAQMGGAPPTLRGPQ